MAIQLCAVSYSSVVSAIRHQRAALKPAGTNGKQPKYYKESGRGISMGISLKVSGDQPVESFIFESPEVSLIWCGDLRLNDAEEKMKASRGLARFLASEYLREGDAFVKKLRGTFAVILYDHHFRVLKAWTDHFGAEKLNFTEADGFVAVATDLRLLRELTRNQPEIDPVSVQEYMQYGCVPAPRTIYKNISRLPGGHQLTSRGTSAMRPYWNMSYTESPDQRSEARWTEETSYAINSAVYKSMMGVDGSRLGCFLSGGTDSSSIAGLVSRFSDQPANTFSIGFDDHRYNEIEYARIAARHHGTNHHEYFVKPEDILTLIERAVPVYDEPFGNSSVIPTYYCAKLAAENGVTHLLAGDGGDELFGGNSRYVEDHPFQNYQKIPGLLRRLLIEPVIAAGHSCTDSRFFDRAAHYVTRSNLRVPDRWFSYSLLSSVPSAELFASDFLACTAEHHPLTAAREHYAAAQAKSDLNRWLYIDLKMAIADSDIRKVTVMSRLAGVTARYPLLEPELAEFSGTIPSSLKVRGSQLRYLFKKAMADVLPPQIIAKRKHGFGLPYSIWLGEHAGLRNFTMDVLTSARFQQRGYFRKGLIEWLWSQYKEVHERFYGDVLWTLLMLELWELRQHDELAEARSQPPLAVAM